MRSEKSRCVSGKAIATHMEDCALSYRCGGRGHLMSRMVCRRKNRQTFLEWHMIINRTTHVLTTLACAIGLAVAATTVVAGGIDSTPPAAVQTNSNATSVTPLPPAQLESLVAPIALYPDALVAQCLNAATFPDQVAIASYWLSQHSSLTGSALAAAVNGQSWDPSVKALTQFPNVLADLAQNLAWVSSLGQAYHNQPADVMDAVQAMRAKAQAAGNLHSTPQIRVVQQAPQTIVIQPANPQVVYVPQYNPTVIYGVPYVVPYYRPVFMAVAPTISFGTGIFIGAGWSGGVGIVGGGGGFNWGFNAWNVQWGGGGIGGGGAVIYNHNTYINNNIWHGNSYSYNGYRPWGPGPHGPWPYGPHPYGNGPHGFAPGSSAMNHYDNQLARRYPADGGDTWKHGGYGPAGAAREGFGPNGDAYRHDADMHAFGGGQAGNRFDGWRGRGDQGQFNSFAGDRSPSAWNGNGASSRAESFRGHYSMARSGQASRSFMGGGGRRRW
jgi:hypothetical protein